MAGKLLSKLVARKNDHDKWELVDPLVYESGILEQYLGGYTRTVSTTGVISHDDKVVVPVGFHTDFASVPRLPVVYMLDGDCGHEAAVVHDYLYYTGTYPRSVADAVFREALLACGESAFRAWSMWLGVRVGGWAAWNKYRRRSE